ncbi:unnamed protein product, partial [Closterium sp. NIES-54]
LTGSIPSWISQLANLTHLVLSNNQLTGSIPLGIGNISRSYGAPGVKLQGYQLSAPLPSFLGKMMT